MSEPRCDLCQDRGLISNPHPNPRKTRSVTACPVCHPREDHP